MAALVPAFLGRLSSIKFDRAINEIGQLQFFIDNFERDNERLPESLEELDGPLFDGKPGGWRILTANNHRVLRGEGGGHDQRERKEHS